LTIEKCRNAGFRECIGKPFGKEKIIKMLRKVERSKAK